MSEPRSDLIDTDQYPCWDHPYKWSGFNPTWVEYLGAAIREMGIQEYKIKLDQKIQSSESVLVRS